MPPSGDVPHAPDGVEATILSLDDETALLQGEAALQEDAPALGRDPFAEDVAIDPFVERLEELGARFRLPRAVSARDALKRSRAWLSAASRSGPRMPGSTVTVWLTTFSDRTRFMCVPRWIDTPAW